MESIFSPATSYETDTVSDNNKPFNIKKEQRRLALKDIIDGIIKWRVWLLISYLDVKLRYRRSSLGPFWITISMAITTYSMGYLYSHLFHINLQIYFPYLVAGMLSWTLISTQVTDLTEALSSSEGLIKQIKLPYTIYIHKIAARNIIIFFHNIIVIIPILAIFHEVAKVNFNTLLLIPGLFVIYVNSISFGLILGMIGARYRDIVQIIKSLIQVAFFLTPIMWSPDILPAKDRLIAVLNPLYCLVELIRAPLLGMTPTLLTICVSALVTVIGIAYSFVMFAKHRSRIIYWL
ncbi:MAG: ABC transporter permease [Gammaproteobacteria bacterium]|nr:ABC transporter permease [Gammaproteobacteria bacterium]